MCLRVLPHPVNDRDEAPQQEKSDPGPQDKTKSDFEDSRCVLEPRSDRQSQVVVPVCVERHFRTLAPVTAFLVGEKNSPALFTALAFSWSGGIHLEVPAEVQRIL